MTLPLNYTPKKSCEVFPEVVRLRVVVLHVLAVAALHLELSGEEDEPGTDDDGERREEEGAHPPGPHPARVALLEPGVLAGVDVNPQAGRAKQHSKCWTACSEGGSGEVFEQKCVLALC